MQSVRVFISSPADVGHERLRAQRVIERLNGQFAGVVRLIPIRWEEKFYEARSSFQSQIPEAASCDVVIGILWSRLGSELPPDMPPMPGGDTYPSGTAYELLTAIEQSREAGRPSVYLFRKMASAVLPIDDEAKRALVIEQLDRLKVFWQRFVKTSEGHFKAGYQEFANPDQFEADLESLLRGWLDERLLKGRALVWPIASKASPFRGLAAFGFKHAPVFFGRGGDIVHAVDTLKDAAERGHPFLLLVGSSGSGKSSLARAGLAPRLTTPGVVSAVDRWRVAMMRPGERKGEAVLALAQRLFEAPNDIPPDDEGRPAALPELGKSSHNTPQRLAAALSAGDAASVVWALDKIAEESREHEGYDRPIRADLLLIVDQLDELFAADVSEAEREVFAKSLQALLATGRIWVIATLRADLYARLQLSPALLALKQKGAACDLAPPGAAELAEIVRKPAEAAGLIYERNQGTGRTLDEQLLDDAGAPDMLPLVQFALQELFDRREANGEETLLTFNAYQEIGGLDGAIDKRAEAALAALGIAEQEKLPRLLRKLAVPAREREGGTTLTTRSASLDEAAPDEDTKRLVEALTDARILLSSGKEGTSHVRLAHERVLQSWGRAHDIVREDADFYRIRDDVEVQQHRWQAANKPDELLIPPGLALEEARKLIEGYGEELDRETRAFIVASLDADDKRLHARRLRGRLTAAAAVLFAIVAMGAIAAGLIAWQAQQRASTEAARAESNFAAAKSAVDSLVVDTVVGLRHARGIKVESLNKMLERVRSAMEQLTKAAPDHQGLLQSQAAMWDQFTQTYVDAGNLAAAEESAEKSLVIRRRLTQTDTDNAESQQDLATTLVHVGDLKASQKDSAKALAAYEESLAIRRHLAEIEKDNTDLQESMARSLSRIGEVKFRQDIPGALAAYEENLGIMRRLAETDRTNAAWQRGLAISLRKQGQIKQFSGDSEEASAAYEESLAILRHLVAIDPASTQGQRDLAMVLADIGLAKIAQTNGTAAVAAYEEGLAIMRRLAETDKGNTFWQEDISWFLGQIGNAKQASGETDRALSAYEESLAIMRRLAETDSNNTTWHSKVLESLKDLSELKLNSGDSAGALINYDALIKLAPDEPDYYNDRGHLYARAGDLDRALADFDEALRLDPIHASALRNRGWTYWQKEELDKALADLDAVLRQAPDDIDTLINHGEVLYDKGDYTGAIADYDRALALRPDNPQALNGRGLAYWQKGEIEKALADFDDAVRLAPHDMDILIDRGGVLNAEGSYGEAIADYDKVLAAEPDNARAWNGRAWARAQKGDLDKALADSERAMTLNPKDPGTVHTRAWIYRSKGFLDHALADFNRVIDLDPELPSVYADRGRTYELKGEHDKAIADYRKTLSLKSRGHYDDKAKAEAEQRLAHLTSSISGSNALAVSPQP